MSFNAVQLRELIIRPSLNALGLYSDDACELLMMTAATETNLGRYVRQSGMEGDKGAFSIYQFEKPAFDMAWDRHVLPSAAIRAKVKLFLGYEGKPRIQRCMGDLCLATIVARLYYETVKEKLPDCHNFRAMSEYYKKYWNVCGKNTPEKAMIDYQQYCR